MPSDDGFLTRDASGATVPGYDGELDGEVWAVRSGDKVYAIAGADGQAEEARKQAESARVTAEAARAEAEAQRAEAQLENDEAQAGNDSAQAKNNADQAANNAAIQRLSPVILTEGQYDPDTLEPTVEGEPNRMYFVPMVAADLATFALEGSEAANAAVEAGNLYVEWMWIDDKWEQMGTSKLETTPIQTDDIDAVAAGAAPSGDSVLNLTGLSYLWSKLREAFAAVAHKHDAADVTSGTLPVARGGTGATTASEALTTLGAASASELDDVRDSLSRFDFGGFARHVRFTVSDSSFGIVFMVNDSDGYILHLPISANGSCKVLHRTTSGDAELKTW